MDTLQVQKEVEVTVPKSSSGTLTNNLYLKKRISHVAHTIHNISMKPGSVPGGPALQTTSTISPLLYPQLDLSAFSKANQFTAKKKSSKSVSSLIQARQQSVAQQEVLSNPNIQNVILTPNTLQNQQVSLFILIFTCALCFSSIQKLHFYCTHFEVIKKLFISQFQ